MCFFFQVTYVEGVCLAQEFDAFLFFIFFQVTYVEGACLAQEFDMVYLEASALLGESVDEVTLSE